MMGSMGGAGALGGGKMPQGMPPGMMRRGRR